MKICILLSIIYYMESNPLCKDLEKATYVCVQKTCTSLNPFLCKTGANCLVQHEECSRKNWTVFSNKFHLNRVLNEQFISSLGIQNTLRSCIKLFQSQLQNFLDWNCNFGVLKEYNDLVKDIKNNRQSRWSGKDMATLYQLSSQLLQEKFQIKQFSFIKQQIQEKSQQIRKLIHKIFNLFKIQLPPKLKPIKIIRTPKTKIQQTKVSQIIQIKMPKLQEEHHKVEIQTIKVQKEVPKPISIEIPKNQQILNPYPKIKDLFAGDIGRNIIVQIISITERQQYGKRRRRKIISDCIVGDQTGIINATFLKGQSYIQLGKIILIKNYLVKIIKNHLQLRRCKQGEILQTSVLIKEINTQNNRNREQHIQ